MDNVKQISEAEMEQILSAMPKQERSREADKAFYAMLEKDVASQYGQEAQPVGLSFFRKFAIGGVLGVFALFLGTVSWAYNPSVTRGHPLYAFKKTLEKVELSLASSPSDEASVHLAFADRRLDEANHMLQDSPNLAWLGISAAKAAWIDNVQFSSETAKNFALTLLDMDEEITLAADVVGEKIFEPEVAEKVLIEIENKAEARLTALEKLEEKAPSNVKLVVRNFRQEQHHHIARSVEAREEVRIAVETKGKKVNLAMLKRNSKEQVTSPVVIANEELLNTITIFNRLPVQRRDNFEKKIQMAQQALREGKAGRAEGLSRALQRQIEFLLKDEKREDEDIKDREDEDREDNR
ncbi:MAG: DUF5667 domain-containing protein, partial [Patescibacteria group bacterium]